MYFQKLGSLQSTHLLKLNIMLMERMEVVAAMKVVFNSQKEFKTPTAIVTLLF